MGPESPWLLLSVVLAADMTLWTSGLILDVSADSRFRLLTAAILLLYVLLGLLLGFAWGSLIWFVGLWVFAILVGLGN